VSLHCCCYCYDFFWESRYHRNADGSGGFVSNLACVTQAGWGYNGRNSYKCAKGTYNGKDTYSDCTVRETLRPKKPPQAFFVSSQQSVVRKACW
jgi:hypothetical protein